ncbi:hypothetical protein CAPTEDRAFT_198855 [Capitella teleta]|uniref:Uncharacterized protein n=1 Tax=Capitella teleta TaxID=283909 RepID=R7T906_CAPTE|nr:hypothetical protein CAPTEDRAFT_198855 [Capitella teleta]|eukprot:ELT87479.1 hypothetical protein CAPTEDRAFT_198855 [Capitella teleta]
MISISENVRLIMPFLAILALSGFEARILRLSPGEYRLLIEETGRSHCQPCSELADSLTTQSDGHVITLSDIEATFGERDEDGGNLTCCVQSAQQILALIYVVSAVSIHREQLQAPQRFALHVGMETTPPTAPTQATERFSDIAVSEWNFSSDLFFCDSGNLAENLCLQFNPRFHSNGIAVPFQGAYTINIRMAWKSPPEGSSNPDFALRVSRIRQGDTALQTLAKDEVRVACEPHRHPCAMARIHQTIRLSRSDSLIISVTHKELVYARPEHTFLDLSGEAFSWA